MTAIWFTLVLGVLFIGVILATILDNLRDIKYVLYDIRRLLDDYSTKHST